MPVRTSVLVMASTQRHIHDASDLLAPTEAAELIGVSTRSLLRWEDAGRIVPLKTPGGHRRYRVADLLALVQERSA